MFCWWVGGLGGEEVGEVWCGGDVVGALEVGACLMGVASEVEIVADGEEGCEVVGVDGEDPMVGVHGLCVLSGQCVA